jgi:hypothetical protein
MAEIMAELKVLAEENLNTLKQNRFKDPEDSIRMHGRIDRINELMKSMNHAWEYIPGEWDDEKKRHNK